ncbi:MAG: hypothetical protein CRN43_16250 [Candidatus Nephrothrix sp. EaCA]|nr:MAG: hypothetical protein CRN43_16250 [Candidatus Nephrothrix sp. EaCA]
MRWIGAVVLFFFSMAAQAQCAMCKATIENNNSHEHAGLAVGLNFGILYLLVVPYLIIGVIALVWYRSSKHAK